MPLSNKELVRLALRSMVNTPIRAAVFASLFAVYLGTIATAYSGYRSVKTEAAIEELRSRDVRTATVLNDLLFKEQQDRENINSLIRLMEKSVQVEENLAQDHKVVSFNLGTQLRLEQNEKAVTALSTRMASLEAALMNSPEKAVALPLMRQDLTDARAQFKDSADGLRADLSHLYTTITWAGTLLVTAFIAFVTIPPRRSKAVEG